MNQTFESRDHGSSDDSQILDVFGLLRRRKRLISLGVFLGVGLAVLYYALTPPTYQAKMEILVGQKSGGVVNGASSSGSVEGSGAEEDMLSTHIQLMTSRRILQAAIDTHDLKKTSSIAEVVRNGGSPIGYILKHLEVLKGGEDVARDAHTLRATFTDPSPIDCALILRGIYDEYVSYLDKHFKGASSQAVDLLTEISEKTIREVEEAETAFEDHLATSTLMWDGEKARNIHKERLSVIETNLLGLIEQESEIKSRLSVITEFLNRSDLENITDFDRMALLSDNEANRLKTMVDLTRGDSSSEAFQAEAPLRAQTVSTEYDEYLKLLMKERKLLERFNEGHPEVMSVREQITLLRNFLDSNGAKIAATESESKMQPAEMLSTYVGLLRNDLAHIQKQREVLETQSSQEVILAKKLERVEMKTESMRREMLRRQEVYRDAQNTLKELSFVRDYAGFSTDVIGDAEEQRSPYWPQPLIVIAVGLFAGLLLGFAAAMAAELMDTTFADPEDVQQTLGAPVMAHVPRFAAMKRGRRSPPLTVDDSVRVFHQPRSAAAEVFRVLRTGLLIDSKTSGHKVLQITSPLPGDGKSTTCVNTAMAFAQTGRRTLLIDCDLRKPRVARLLHLPGSLGLTDILTERCEPSEAIQETVQPNLFAISAGNLASNPAELLQSERFAQLLNLFRDQYDCILIDTPPVLAVSDAAIVSEETDAVILAVRIIKNGRRSAKRAVEILRQSKASVDAIVVNGYQTKDPKYGYAGTYDADSYGYGYGENNKAYYSDERAPEKQLESVS